MEHLRGVGRKAFMVKLEMEFILSGSNREKESIFPPELYLEIINKYYLVYLKCIM